MDILFSNLLSELILDFGNYAAGFFLASVFPTPFNGLLPHFPEVQCPNFLDFRNPWGKFLKELVSDLKTFAHKGFKIAAANKSLFTGEL